MKTAVWELEKTDYQISFGMTIDRLLALQKTVTRRYWSHSYVQRLLRYCQSGKAVYATTNWQNGEVVGLLTVTSITADILDDITQDEVNLEGYPELTPEEFLERFFGDRLSNKKPGYCWWRIEFNVELYDGKYKPLKTYHHTTPLIYNHKQQKLKTWSAYLLAFDIVQSGALEFITDIDTFCIIQAANNSVNTQVLKSFLMPYLSKDLSDYRLTDNDRLEIEKIKANCKD